MPFMEPEVHYRVNKSLPLDFIPKEVNPVCTMFIWDMFCFNVTPAYALLSQVTSSLEDSQLKPGFITSL